MPQIFPRYANTLARVSLFGLAFIIFVVSWALGVIYRAPWSTGAGSPVSQPVPFSHKHHVGEGFDCRYCHTSVEISSFAGIPPTKTCMNCHSLIWSDSPVLEPVRQSFVTGKPLAWTRVYDLPDFVFFDHSVHIAKGIGCSTCHGRVDLMPLTWVHTRIQMEWCLHCHRNPEKHVRPRDQVLVMDYEPPPDQEALGARLVREYGIQSYTNCTTCHR